MKRSAKCIPCWPVASETVFSNSTSRFLLRSQKPATQKYLELVVVDKAYIREGREIILSLLQAQLFQTPMCSTVTTYFINAKWLKEEQGWLFKSTTL